ncbi:MAG TPA: hypothetical protein VI790_05360 [Candidatus Nanoarchaeia archaeon]|nr:hypothetical protein [Candidatus Nanoarchaeia archaeon]
MSSKELIDLLKEANSLGVLDRLKLKIGTKRSLFVYRMAYMMKSNEDEVIYKSIKEVFDITHWKSEEYDDNQWSKLLEQIKDDEELLTFGDYGYTSKRLGLIKDYLLSNYPKTEAMERYKRILFTPTRYAGMNM